MNAEGVVKYASRLLPGPPPDASVVAALNRVRTELHELGLVGSEPDGTGYGNLSIRDGAGFWVTGSGTGRLRRLEPRHYTRVETADPERNRVVARGAVPASAEAMTHAAVYAASPAAGAVFHVHSAALFGWLLHAGCPATAADIPYGTPAMARAVAALVSAAPSLPLLFAMAGHEPGAVACGADVQSTRGALLSAYEEAKRHDENRTDRRQRA